MTGFKPVPLTLPADLTPARGDTVPAAASQPLTSLHVLPVPMMPMKAPMSAVPAQPMTPLDFMKTSDDLTLTLSRPAAAAPAPTVAAQPGTGWWKKLF